MTNYIQSFNEFESLNEDLILEDLFSLHEKGIMPKYNSTEFKNIFSGYLNESNVSIDEESLNEAHSYYEISMLAEARSSWGETEGEINYIDADTHVILIKNSEAFIIEKKTLEMSQSLNEWSLPSWGDIKSGFTNFSSKVTTYAKDKLGKIKKSAAKALDALSDGAKKAWGWVKTAIAATGKFISDNIGTITLVLSILSAVCGIVGTTVPGFTVVGGVLMALNGGLHIYEGFHKYHEGMEMLENIPLDPTTKLLAGVVKAGPEFLMGGLFACLGFYDISHGLTEALANPAAGSISAGVKTTATKAAHSWVGSIGHTIEKILGGFVKNFYKDPKLGAQIGKAAVGVSSVVLAKFFNDVCGWLYEFVLKSADLILKGINWILDIPKKLTDAINKFSKSADGVIQNIIAKGLNSLVKPMTEFLARMNEKYFKPMVKKAQEFISRQIAAKKILDVEMKKHGEHAEEKKPAIKIPNNKGIPLVKPNVLKGDKKDAKLLKELPKVNDDIKKADIKFSSKKVSESLSSEMNYLRSFDDLEFI